MVTMFYSRFPFLYSYLVSELSALSWVESVSILTVVVFLTFPGSDRRIRQTCAIVLKTIPQWTNWVDSTKMKLLSPYIKNEGKLPHDNSDGVFPLIIFVLANFLLRRSSRCFDFSGTNMDNLMGKIYSAFTLYIPLILNSFSHENCYFLSLMISENIGIDTYLVR